MQILNGQNPITYGIARAIIDGFDKHYRLFRECGYEAKFLFEAADWHGIHRMVKNRIQFYDDRVQEVVERLHAEFLAEEIEDNTWQQVKLIFIGLLTNHKQPELAETFFNSVFCRIMHRNYFHNDFIFFRPAISTQYLESDPPTYRSYYPHDPKMQDTMKQLFLDFGWRRPFADLDRDIRRVREMVRRHFGGKRPKPEANHQLQVLHSPFYRNKAAYVVGKVVNGHQEHPFVIPVLHDAQGKLYLDTVLLEEAHINVLFSLNRAYFLVDMEVPSAYVQFLRKLMPTKNVADLYTMIGLQKQGKTVFYRDLYYHLYHSRDDFIIAPGIPGMVMLVFMLPSFPYVFKLIKDLIPPPKEVDRATVKAKYLLVKQHDRVGRMSDTLEFSDVALPRARFDPALLDELRRVAPSQVEEEGDTIIIRHLYIEQRMVPLNLYLEHASEEEAEHAVQEYGDAIRELASANIFPGDMLWKNFGVTRYRYVVFYDYDEIEYLTDCNFRRIPPCPYPELELSGEPWYPVARNDIFPEEFAHFLLGSPKVRKLFMKHHADLLSADYWAQIQQKVRDGMVVDFFPYPEELRFCHLFEQEPGASAETETLLQAAAAS
ncbi:MAG TPA: bifunctional isocitrate dehydrogenase kinase/phosphatase [Gammaproteobacteria bacterium]